jgi:hypothetical protein
MTNQQHPITPPAELVQQWILDKQLGEFYSELNDPEQYFATQAARWGADQELEACCEVLHQHDHAYLLPSQLHAARRPKPPSLKEQALIELCNLVDDLRRHGLGYSSDTIRRALEQLDD